MVQNPTRIVSANHSGPESQLIERIRSVFLGNQQINHHADSLQVSVEKTLIVLTGHLPTSDLKQQLVPAIRQAGILWQVCNLVQVPTLTTAGH
jgi:hypothetical protein